MSFTRDNSEGKMKKRILIIIAVVAALVITGGTYAATYTTASATIGVTAVESDFATVTANLTATAPTVFGDYTSTWPGGHLFTVVPDPGYTGDLVVKAYITNTGELHKYYEHLNMELQFWSSDNSTADEQGISQMLTLDNSEVFFTWANGTGTGPYQVELIGGGYRLHPWKTMSGASVQPKLWLEIVQR